MAYFYKIQEGRAIRQSIVAAYASIDDETELTDFDKYVRNALMVSNFKFKCSCNLDDCHEAMLAAMISTIFDEEDIEDVVFAAKINNRAVELYPTFGVGLMILEAEATRKTLVLPEPLRKFVDGWAGNISHVVLCSTLNEVVEFLKNRNKQKNDTAESDPINKVIDELNAGNNVLFMHSTDEFALPDLVHNIRRGLDNPTGKTLQDLQVKASIQSLYPDPYVRRPVRVIPHDMTVSQVLDCIKETKHGVLVLDQFQLFNVRLLNCIYEALRPMSESTTSLVALAPLCECGQEKCECERDQRNSYLQHLRTSAGELCVSCILGPRKN